MVDKVSNSDFEDGVSGSGEKWQKRVKEAADEGKYGTGDEGQENYADNAGTSAADSRYKSNVAEAFGLDEGDVAVAPSDGIDEDTAQDWAKGVQDAGDRWADGVKETSANEWEESTKESSTEWLENTREGLQEEL
jgi:hypothetical protein